jgi:enoyl-[acyl-carrier protein] reductase II
MSLSGITILVKTRLTQLLGIEHPIIQAGMSWASSCAPLPVAVSNAGGLGVIAAGPMFVDAFRDTVRAVRHSTTRPYAVNVPLYRPQVEDILNIVEEERVPIVIASQGGPRAHLERFRRIGCKWLHVVSTLEHARKAASAGVDALVVVGAEAGGHPPANGVSSIVGVRRVLQAVDLPVVAGGGVADGYGVAAMLALGADAVQLGTRFLLTEEASVHLRYKQAVLAAEVDGTTLVGKPALPVRMLRNRFAHDVAAAERDQMDSERYEALLRSSSLKQAALDGDVEWGKVEMGQSAGLVNEILPAAHVMQKLVEEMRVALRRLQPA